MPPLASFRGVASAPFGRIFVACVFGFATVACGDADPPPRITSHPSSEGAGDGSGGSAVGDLGGGAQDAGQSFRDPKPTDGGCSAPNVVCSIAIDAGDAGDAGVCIDVTHDPDHCGSCENKCIGPTATCVGGQCACGPGFDYCSGQGCMDVSSDTNNCGACGNVCDPNQFSQCIGGACAE
jgi:hypothetical protein